MYIFDELISPPPPPAVWPWMTWFVGAKLMTSSITSQKCGRCCLESSMTLRWAGKNRNKCCFNMRSTSDHWFQFEILTVSCLHFRNLWGRLQTWHWKHSVRSVCVQSGLFECLGFYLFVCPCGHPSTCPLNSLFLLCPGVYSYVWVDRRCSPENCGSAVTYSAGKRHR